MSPEKMQRRATTVLRAIGVAAAVLVAGLLTTFAIPIEAWRTGDQRLAPLTFAPVQSAPNVVRRLWIDADAACGHGRRTDPDDCLAIALLARASRLEIVGLSTVFGNASRDVVDRTTRELVAKLSVEVGRTIPVFPGSAGPLAREAPVPGLPAHDALMAALEQGPLTVVALGPLTNLAAVLRERPDLASQVARLVAVMGRRPGHLFHPAEGADAGLLFGHGPVFRDFNFVMDIDAAAQIVALNLPMSLIPYDAARGIEITADDLDRLAESGGSNSWLADRARRWLDYWQEDIGRQGFYPFDLLAAAYAAESHQFRCAPVRVWVGEDHTLFIPFWRPKALLVGQGAARLEKAQVVEPALYCAKPAADLKSRLMDRFRPAAITLRGPS
jgi:inosine-uridine nucleoside N-ribohydrolase